MSLLLEAAAAILVAGCSSSLNGNTSCPNTGDRTVSPQTACQILAEGAPGYSSLTGAADSSGATCGKVCGGLGCVVADAFVQKAQALNPEFGTDAGGDGGALNCPTGVTSVTVTCEDFCTGRRTQGAAPLPAGAPGDPAARLVAMAHLEAVSVHAFERLERELSAHGAPPSLRRDARRARRDEVRHAAMTRRLARRRGGLPTDLPEAVPLAPRPLREVALENAVEGCVRETYGAVVGLVEARTSPDAPLRRALASIAVDECRHAELAWAVHAWAMPRLPPADREAVRAAMAAAIAELATHDPVSVARVFQPELTGRA